jgi:hypothetical protein
MTTKLRFRVVKLPTTSELLDQHMRENRIVLTSEGSVEPPGYDDLRKGRNYGPQAAKGEKRKKRVLPA